MRTRISAFQLYNWPHEDVSRTEEAWSFEVGPQVAGEFAVRAIFGDVIDDSPCICGAYDHADGACLR